ncbi:Site-specific recombinase [Moritella viscosa]|uniref:Site-specific recombinase n=1 Tax=Moritella viscosa TaxID=80854 RepID=A0A1K9YZ02_9GAMM|nr:Site-specific recombinase [Moritella viscosa]SHN98350.1 Site-specific recombinase [Moritella viscosa]SHN98354.1 Site-specific recombinase [Moritella viscosa]SHN98361.1 Site-specific recombinase [Moritella viscosa]SHO00177.1 Site-specific recombinase [Moritella viscosa]
MDRLARNLDDLRHLVKKLTNKGISVFFVKEGLTFNGEDSPMSHLLLSVMGAFAEFERALIKERQHEGIVLAKKKDVYKGRKQALKIEQITELTQRAVAGENKTALASEYKISRQTLYSYLKGS